MQRIVRRCLAKDPEDRYQTIKDVATELKELRRELEDAAEIERSISPETTSDSQISKAGAETISISNRRSASTAEVAAHSTSSAEYIASEIKRHKTTVGIAVLALLLTIGGLGFAVYKFWGKSDKPRQATKNERLTTNGKSSDAAISPDGKYVVYVLNEGGQQSLWTRQVATTIWIMNADGSGQKQLTVDAGTNYDFKVTPDGRYIVFTSERAGQPSLWRIDLDGGNPRQLTSGTSDYGAAVSPDSKWVIYNSNNSGKPALWKVSIDGGSIVQLTEYAAENPEVSPDGKLIACLYREDANSPWRHAIIPFEGGEPLKVFDVPGSDGGDIRWSPDGRSLNYLDTRVGVTNIWGFQLDGSTPKQLTDFKTDQIYNFKWSANGKQLVLSRGTTTSEMSY